MTPTASRINRLVTPDASAARKVRQIVADQKLGLGVKVVTWFELVEDVRLAYLYSPIADNWTETVRNAIADKSDGFWRKSFEIDPSGTTTVIATALDEAIRGGGKTGGWSSPSLSKRTNTTLSDLRRLWEQTENALPPELDLIESVRDNPDRAMIRFSVHWIEGWPHLDHHQIELLNLLNDQGGKTDETLMSILRVASSLPKLSGTTRDPQKLAHLCFTGSKSELQPSDDIGFLLARDPLEEVECTAGIIQSMTKQGVAVRDIGVLLPNDPYYGQSLGDALSVIGVPAAGLADQIPLRDLGGEIVRSLILLARGPVPKMALASLVASPAAPWGKTLGVQMASSVMAGRFDLKSPYGMSEDCQKHLAVIRRLRDGKTSIVDAIEVFVQNTDDPVHVSRLRSLAKLIVEQSPEGGEPDFDSLLELVGHVTATADQPTRFPQSGIRVFHETQEPWTKVKHLIVLGFNGGRYPSLPGTSPVFHDLEKQAITEHLGWDLPTAETVQSIRRSRFQRQIASATLTIKFMASARTIEGSPKQPAETATFMAGLLGQEPEELFVPVHQDEKWLPRADEAIPAPPRQPTPSDLNLDRDLLVLRTNENGDPLPESPSSLETVLVSPLAWLLGRIGAQPDLWSADTMDALLQGNIAHGVFEHLFTVNGDLIEKDAVEDAVDKALTAVIRQQAPLLSMAQWKVERNSLRSTLVQAVANWRDVLEALDAKVVGVEARLKGEFSGVPIKGFSDEIVQLPGGKLVVVDFKKSSSGKRRDRMELGYDCQVSLYEKMIADNPSDLGLEGSSEQPGIVYYTLNDQRVLADDRTGLTSKVPGLVVISNDVSSNALTEIKHQLAKLHRGVVEMNRIGDAKRLEKEKALPNYALVSSPLVMMFAHPEPAEDAQ
jgi:ATP-dependent helicase/nuclease subunit B